MSAQLRLQVMICTFGAEGIRRVAAGCYPRVEGVEYLVSWQMPDGEADMPRELAERDDFRIARSATRGLGLNRKLCLAAATAPLVLAADDDLRYTPEGLLGVIEAFDSRPKRDLLTFRYATDGKEKRYPDAECDLREAPRNYYVSCVEIAFRREAALRAGVDFNPWFGVASLFPSGEDALFVEEAMRKGLSCAFVPATVCFHPGDSTGIRRRNDPAFIEAKAAIISHIHPIDWPLRMAAHAMREAGGEGRLSRMAYVRAWLSGVAKARRRHVFDR